MMKALFHRFKKEKEKDKFLSSTEPAVASLATKEKLELPPLRPWPPTDRVTTTPNSFNSTKPLPDLAARPLPPIDRSPVSLSHTNSQASSDSRSSTKTPLPAAAQNQTSAVAPAPLSSRASSFDERTSLGFGTVTRTELPRRDSIEPSATGQPSRGVRKTTDASATMHAANAGVDGVAKKVAFISPPPTPIPLQRALSEPNSIPGKGAIASASTVNSGAQPNANGNNSSVNDNGNGSGETASKNHSAPLKTTVTRFQATHGSETRGSTSTASSSKVNVASKGPSATSGKVTVTSTRTALSPTSQKTFMDNASINASMRSATPYSQTSQASSRILATASWSEAAEEDLVSNLGPRERTRQEVLWEIVASEERYVNELTKLKETFIEPLLHPYASPPTCSPTPNDNDEYYARGESPRESFDHLPIAARFLSPTPGLRPETPATGTIAVHTTTGTKQITPNIDGDSFETDEEEAQDQIGRAYIGAGTTSGAIQRWNGGGSALAAAVEKVNHPRSPYNTMSQRNKNRTELPFPTRSHQSLPPPPRALPQGSTASLGRQSTFGTPEREVSYAPTQQTDKSTSSRVLKKLRRNTPQSDVLVGESVPPNQLPEDLRKCLEVLEAGIYHGHVTLSESLRKRYEEQYPLVRSLADVFVSSSHILREYATYVLHLERALEQVDNALSTASDKKKPKNQDAAMWMKVCKSLQRLEQDAVEKGETGLAISLSKPFQRLLKYPLLFQNLLYHTDPSTFEYESTLLMVAEVETIVRSIEDEKIQKEERDQTRDAFARIDGLEKVRQLALPKSSRLLVEERPLVQPSQTQSQPAAPVRLPPPSAGAVKNIKSKSSFRRLSDVLQYNSANSVGGKKDMWLVVFNDVIENWDIAGLPDPKQGVVSMDDVVRSRATVHSGTPTGHSSLMPPDEEEDENDSSDSDRKSKMSFSYWGADKVTIHKPAVKSRAAATANRKGSLTPLGYSRESSANAKFGSRLVNSDSHHPHPHPRPTSRRTQVTPASRRPAYSEDGHSTAKLTLTGTGRPAWDGSTRAGTTTPISSRTRIRNVSATSSNGVRASNNKLLASPAPSEDSGVGLYRQFIAQDSQLNVT
ncbi:hypothetical protein EW145_g3874 [Phellinidium pouzarii]|uniref:DH domain-containing protein n=1 Tax=Phellinidium pouzarii TaxID=167371 RepID=A0A4S4L5J8_9AGAM|nr:hypothetical protein EW145_g3874 [Phellinidium pouzarii]